MKPYCSGDVGYCNRLGHSIGVLIGWENNTVVSLDCQHETCGYSQVCDLYKRHPIGFTKEYPKQTP